eukprot:CAMPEP_0118713224 /NCGR_PEP_ID=MMETSP0800-20121206/25369_1 /TAXON_ID=210618 ORGANISM="Striatella unipunctata, Strain CCMP2910" /NCGR_SAMPLE_ID=MMETSP0800 /ASSEMBLY_ACC=CAM_ASM_000638 /LENGTH=342 /DNA_ID=CAMNT_0006618595 /DNA_START=121 /DNA_END=1150 /DNA_ORIENTATION=-
MALFFNLGITGLLAAASLLSGNIAGALMGLLMFGMLAWFTCSVWSRIPFAASNLATAVTAVRANIGVSGFAYSSLIMMFLWFIWWSIAAASTSYVLAANAEANCDGDECEVDAATSFASILFLLSLHWTSQVINNVVHVTEGSTRFLFSLGYNSFGSICLGSLIVAIIQTLRDILQQMREQDDGMLVCLADCCLGILETIAEIFNKWAFVYVGLYGYSFVEAGKNVMTLFYSRGWTSIISDYLVDRVLLMVSLLVGLVTGVLALLIAMVGGTNWGDLAFVPFLLGLLMGTILTMTLMSVVGSAVNTVIVCFAEAPNEFQTNHPELSNQMRHAWQQAFPGEFN